MKIETGKYLLMPAIITILEFLKAVWEGSVKFITFGNIFFESTPYWVIGNATGFWGFCKYPKTCTRLIYLLNNQYWFNYLQYAYYLYCGKATILLLVPVFQIYLESIKTVHASGTLQIHHPENLPCIKLLADSIRKSLSKDSLIKVNFSKRCSNFITESFCFRIILNKKWLNNLLLSQILVTA